DQEVDPVVAMLARLDRREQEVRADEKDKTDTGTGENLWTSVGFAAGSFNTIAGNSNPQPAGFNTATALAAPIVDQEAKASGYAYSMGVNVGTRIAERWVLQGGVNYMTQASEYTSSNVVVSSGGRQQRFRPAAINELVNASDQELS